MWEPFWAFYKENEDYHNIKENVIWTAFTLYLSFVVSSFIWYISQECFIYYNICIIISIEICISIFAIVFIIFQNWNKARSVEIANRMNTLLGKMDTTLTYEELRNKICWPTETTSLKEKRQKYWKYGYIGNTLILFIIVLIIVKVIFLCNY
jgi:hypothetical protein